MADSTITGLGAAATIAGSELLECVQSGANKKVSVANATALCAHLAGSETITGNKTFTGTVAAPIGGLTGVLGIAHGGSNSTTTLTGNQIIESNAGGTAYQELVKGGANTLLGMDSAGTAHIYRAPDATGNVTVTFGAGGVKFQAPAGGSGASLSSSNTFTVGPQVVVCDADAHSGVNIVIHSATQSAPAFQVLASDSTTVLGQIFIGDAGAGTKLKLLDPTGVASITITAETNDVNIDTVSSGNWYISSGGAQCLRIGGNNLGIYATDVACLSGAIFHGADNTSTPGTRDITLRGGDIGGVLPGDNVIFRGGDGGSGNQGGGTVYMRGGAKNGSGTDGNVVVLHDGTNANGKFCVGNTIGSATTAVGALSNKWPIYDQTGTLIGYVPLYATIT